MDHNGHPPDELAAKRGKRGTKPGRKAGSTAGPLTGDKAIALRKKEADAVQLRVAGASLAVIAERVGYADASGAHRAITRALQEMLPEQERAEARRLEVAKLDRLEMSAWPNALAGDDKAAATVLRCISRRCTLLGLDAPAQLDVRLREGEPVHVEILEVLNDETLAALAPFQEELVRWTEMRANAIDVESS